MAPVVAAFTPAGGITQLLVGLVAAIGAGLVRGFTLAGGTGHGFFQTLTKVGKVARI
ncbi:MAG: hypothetical protein NT034_04230 [Candidatus Magasanikbacteria bacterium]|nr:hypothetical protein [Candidatus Magasanikbacteria bacterium]